MNSKLESLKNILDSSNYTVALCGDGILKECGYPGLFSLDVAYDIEDRYGDSPEYIYSGAYFNTRPEKFFQFYKAEILNIDIEPSATFYALAELEKQGKLQQTIATNVFRLAERAGCKHVINLYGNINDNICPHCGTTYDLEYMRTAKHVPLCKKCNTMLRPKVKLLGEMVDHQLITKIADEVSKADVLLLLSTSLNSTAYKEYIKYFEGSSMVIIHSESHYSDENADLVFIDEPQNILPEILTEDD